jgi:hypothetical protein
MEDYKLKPPIGFGFEARIRIEIEMSNSEVLKPILPFFTDEAE